MSAPAKQTAQSSNHAATSAKTAYVPIPLNLTEKMSCKEWPDYRAGVVKVLKGAQIKYEDKTHVTHKGNFKGELSGKDVIDNVMKPLLQTPKELNTINAIAEIMKVYHYDALNGCGVASQGTGTQG